MSRNRDTGTSRTPRERDGSFILALMVTIATAAALFAVGAFVMYVGRYSDPSPLPWISSVGGILFGLSIPAAVGFAIARRPRAAAGILAGAAIGVAGAGLSCFAIISP